MEGGKKIPRIKMTRLREWLKMWGDLEFSNGKYFIGTGSLSLPPMLFVGEEMGEILSIFFLSK